MRDYYMPKTPITDAMVVTNADRIRAMSDEELSVVLMEACAARELCGGCPAQNCSPKCPGESYGAWEEWLKQPAEDATNENISNPQSGDAHKN